jgi:ATP-binding cassette, subfamily G (WHITE), member 2, PDR
MVEPKPMEPDGGSTAVQSISNLESDVEKKHHKDTNSSAGMKEEDIADHETEQDGPGAAERGIAELARRLTRASIQSGAAQHDNPFLSQSPSLDPWSPQFNVKEWGRTLLHAMGEDPNKYPRHPFGVSWRDVRVHGYGYDTDYQKDVLNVLWRGPMIAKEWFSHRKQKVQILQDFDGLVRPGEMLLVLGRPGR